MERDIGEQGIAREMLQEADDRQVKTSVCANNASLFVG
jgi:hypothetical protein